MESENTNAFQSAAYVGRKYRHAYYPSGNISPCRCEIVSRHVLPEERTAQQYDAASEYKEDDQVNYMHNGCENIYKNPIMQIINLELN